ncbi:MAG: patatin-like phospholipase family protein [Acidobacteriota bacterium]
MRQCSAIALILLALAAPTAASGPPAEEPQPHEARPRIGLVLSGGAARGSAHVGVLKVLEELRVPVDFVAGTSMGAIVGGLYSAGVSAAEMEDILSEIDWRDLLDDQPPRRSLPYRQKVDDQTYLSRFEAGFNRGSFQLRPGLISGQKLGFAFQLLALQAIGIDDFDQLPTPFRAVATDLETGEMVVLGHGDLGQALRASMSLPGVFSPIEIDGRLLVDGGLVRNLPVDVARTMGADVVIAVSVAEPLLPKEDLQSMPQVISQAMGLQIANSVREQEADADVLIQPILEGFGSSQFERGAEMVPFGEEAAQRVADQLRRYSVSEDEYRSWLDGRQRAALPATASIGSVQISATGTADPEFALRQVETGRGDSFDLETIRRDLQRLYHSGDYERVDFRLVRTGDEFHLIIEPIDKSWGPNYLRFGVGLSADLEGEGFSNLLTSYTMTKLNSLRGELKVQTQLGENPELFAEFYQPLSTSQTLFAATWLRRATSTVQRPLQGGAVAPYRDDSVTLGVDLGVQWGRFAEFRLGLFRGALASELRLDSSVPTDLPRELESDFAAVRFGAVFDQFDNVNFPRNGYLGFVDLRAYREDLGGELDYETLYAFLGVAATRGRHTLLGLSNVWSALGSESPEIQELGGLFRLSGYSQGSISGRYGGSLALLYLFRLFELPTGIGDGVYLGASLEAGNLWQDEDQVDLDDLRYSASLSLGLDTVFGPLYLAGGFGEDEESALYLLIGRSF